MLVKIHPLAFNHVQIRLKRLWIAIEGIPHDQIKAVTDLTVEQITRSRLPRIEASGKLLNRLLLCFRTVHELIGAPAPDVDGPDRPTLGRGHQQGSEVKGLRPPSRLLAALLIGLRQGGKHHGSGRTTAIVAERDSHFVPPRRWRRSRMARARSERAENDGSDTIEPTWTFRA